MAHFKTYRTEVFRSIFNIRAEIVDEVRALRTLEYMTQERDFLPWYTALGSRLPYIKRMLYSTSAFGELQVTALNCYHIRGAGSASFFKTYFIRIPFAGILSEHNCTDI